MQHHVEILKHDILWSAKDVKTTRKSELDFIAKEDIARFINDDLSSGQFQGQIEGMKGTREVTICWQIIKWRDIACNLYNSLPPKGSRNHIQEASAKMFYEKW